ncbi:Dbl homology domain-containing protein [Piptocephalis cylindrospora]|uniref:Dbl homology domain-containing protein n=1 Tax=Piptocephalis cylindrospora TaxID=1907219 RepID=A0A4P9Y6P8_9FUNG|nr:Dbl homology domain-containing protein [Piptocephalis cylindrospora]|eukprot:RKP13901.1 Dbl homology domain-containing protein [Piptocephalis cylindrospora]
MTSSSSSSRLAPLGQDYGGGRRPLTSNRSPALSPSTPTSFTFPELSSSFGSLSSSSSSTTSSRSLPHSPSAHMVMDRTPDTSFIQSMDEADASFLRKCDQGGRDIEEEEEESKEEESGRGDGEETEQNGHEEYRVVVDDEYVDTSHSSSDPTTTVLSTSTTLSTTTTNSSTSSTSSDPIRIPSLPHHHLEHPLEEDEEDYLPTWESEGDYLEGESRCAQAVKDLYTSERAYVKALKRTHGLYARPLRDHVVQQIHLRAKAGRRKGKALGMEATEEDVMIIFGPVEDILVAHDKLLKGLDERDLEGESTEGITKAFQVLEPSKGPRNPGLAIEKNWTSKGSFNILACLLQPIERFPYYAAFLNTLVRWTPPGHADMEGLAELAQIFDQGLSGVLNVMHESEAHLQVLDVQANLHGLPEPLATVRRRLVYQGRGHRVHAITKDKEPLVILLFDDCMLWVKESTSKGLTFRGKMMLRRPVVTAISPNEGYGWCFALQNDGRTEIWSLSSEEEREGWIFMLEDVLGKACQRSSTEVKRVLGSAQEQAVMTDMDRIL